MTNFSDLEYIWDTSEARLEAHAFYWKCFVIISRFIIGGILYLYLIEYFV